MFLPKKILSVLYLRPGFCRGYPAAVILLFGCTLLLLVSLPPVLAQDCRMMYGDTSYSRSPFAKDPMVVKFKGKYIMYYSLRKKTGEANTMQGWVIGIAVSKDMCSWTKTAELGPSAEYEKNGICAPGVCVKRGRLHLFYQTYGNGSRDAICHAVSDDGLTFRRDPTNPVFRPSGDWNNGRAIDAEVIYFKRKWLLYFATRDPTGTIQQLGLATAPGNSDFQKKDWKLAANYPVLKPQQPWEGNCVEGASVTRRGKFLYMFYAGNYNNSPQQIGVCRSADGIHWTRIGADPFLPNGRPGSWNSCESGHPCIFRLTDRVSYLFFQGNNDDGKSWFISKTTVRWRSAGPYLSRRKE